MERSRGSKNMTPERNFSISIMVQAVLTTAYVARFYDMPKESVKGIQRRSKKQNGSRRNMHRLAIKTY